MMVKKMSWCKLRVLRQKVSKLQVSRRKFSTSSSNVEPSRSEPRISPINIQLLSEPLYKQIFTRSQTSTSLSSETASNQSSEVNNGTTNISGNSRADVKINANVNEIKPEMLKEIKKHLQSHKLWDKQTVVEKDVSFQLPPLLGNDIEEHFMNLGRKQTQDYFELAERLQNSEIPSQPKQWEYAVGWTKYHADGTTTSVDYPDDDVLVFDVELVVTEGNYPTMATAVSDKHWFSWCSEYLVLDKFHWSQGIQMDELIPLEPTPGSNDIGSRPKLVIGHNVGFDRTYVKEQYYIKKSKLRFMDTMSMHIAVCGLTNFQRVLYKASKSNSNLKAVADFRKKQKLRGVAPSEDWLEVSTMNNLADVHQLHVGGDRLNKDKRNIFVEGNMVDVRHYFQDLMCYCATDVKSTCEVFKVLWREFNDRFPHPVTLAGMMEMGTGYLPINQNWDRYIHQSNTVFADMQTESKQILMKIANDACQYSKDDRYKEDPWLWNLDWAVKPIRIKKQVVKKPRKKKGVEEEIPVEVEKTDDELVSEVLQVQDRHYKTTGDLIGYPTWYRDLCPRMSKEDWTPGPSNISYQTRVTPKLLRLTWDTFPLHYDDTHGWGYLVPGNIQSLQEQDMILQEQEMMEEECDVEKDEKPNINAQFPYSQLCKIMNINPDGSRLDQATDHGLDTIIDGEIITEGGMTDEEFEQLQYIRMNSDGFNNDSWKHLDKVGESENRRRHIPIKPGKKQGCKHTGDGPYHDVNIPGCWFFKIPHKDGKGLRVGNPLAKDYANRAEDGTLRPQSDNGADNVLQLNKACSYWKMNQKRIESQMIVSLKEDEIPDTVKMAEGYSEGSYIGAIVPRIVPAGTITRRAVEPTWLTASNAYTDRVGSELKSMIQAPPGYNFVGADVDSQELWIGAILGDAHFGKSHGCTALGWMTLQGNKKDKTDLHSVVADTVDISRDHAKIFNYGRIYGAGQKFAQKLLLQFNHRLSEKQAKEKATLLFTTTKGKKSNGKWEGGSESSMFNQLEDIARRDCPQTPVLGCRISKALEPENVNDEFMTSRINWVVQSSAVDYLHLMLVSMRWLFDEFDIDGRFCISIHDEVRYLVSSEDRYRAALALQITNLLTRSMFAHKLGIQDLPQSVAFFSAVDIDKCLRKEVTMDCVTPSNPHGMVRGYQIQQGEALDIHQTLEITQGSLEKAKPHKHQMVEEEIQPDIAVQI